MKDVFELQEKYENQLKDVRQNFNLLNNYCFDKSAENSNHFERLRLNIAIYNDLKSSDFEIAKFLFTEENKWRKDAKDGEVDNLYFSAFILTQFKNPEIIWIFYDTKNIDFDSHIGFDDEYLVASGIKKTYEYLQATENSQKKEFLNYVGETIDSCKYSQDEIDNWIKFKKEYFRIFTYPIDDEIYFFYTTKEKAFF